MPIAGAAAVAAGSWPAANGADRTPSMQPPPPPLLLLLPPPLLLLPLLLLPGLAAMACHNATKVPPFLNCHQLCTVELRWLNSSATAEPLAALRFSAFGVNYTLSLSRMPADRLLVHPEARLLLPASLGKAAAEPLLAAATYYEGHATAVVVVTSVASSSAAPANASAAATASGAAVYSSAAVSDASAAAAAIAAAAIKAPTTAAAPPDRSTSTSRSSDVTRARAHGFILSGRFHGVVRTRYRTIFIEPYDVHGPTTEAVAAAADEKATAAAFGAGMLALHLVYRASDVVPRNVTRRMAASDGLNDTLQFAVGDQLNATDRSSEVAAGDGSESTGIAAAAAGASATALKGAGAPAASARTSGRIRRQAAVTAASAAAATSARRFCSIHAVVDSSFVSRMAAGNLQAALNEIVYHVQEASELFLKTDFNGDGLPDAIGLLIANVTFIDKLPSFDYDAPSRKKDPQEFLDLFSLKPYPRTCVALLFTYQDMPSTLGMAWVARPSALSLHGIGSRKNHGFVTCSLDGVRVSRPGISITVGHELGHSFGSSHDAIERGTVCAPNIADGGTYIMYPMVSTGAHQNNFRFSPCSRRAIDVVLERRRLTALTENIGTHCGNGVVESGEECDCGQSESCDEVDPCCTPPEGNAGGDKGCRIRRSAGARCSPLAMPCCLAGCTVAPRNGSRVCAPATECAGASSCDGATGLCPPPPAVPDGALCNAFTQVCLNGRCTGTACLLLNLTQCLCADEANLCALCCRTSASADAGNAVVGGGRCVPFRTLAPLASAVPSWLPAGSLCAGQSGYCDEQHVCQVPGSAGLPDNAGRLASELSAGASHWFSEHWQYVVGAAALVAALSALARGLARVRSPELWAESYRSGATARVYFEARRRLRLVDNEARLLRLSSDAAARSFADVAKRLADAFPTAVGDGSGRSEKVVGAAAAAVAVVPAALLCGAFSEEECVRRLLALGYPMRASRPAANSLPHSEAAGENRGPRVSSPSSAKGDDRRVETAPSSDRMRGGYAARPAPIVRPASQSSREHDGGSSNGGESHAPEGGAPNILHRRPHAKQGSKSSRGSSCESGRNQSARNESEREPTMLHRRPHATRGSKSSRGSSCESGRNQSVRNESEHDQLTGPPGDGRVAVELGVLAPGSLGAQPRRRSPSSESEKGSHCAEGTKRSPGAESATRSHGADTHASKSGQTSNRAHRASVGKSGGSGGREAASAGERDEHLPEGLDRRSRRPSPTSREAGGRSAMRPPQATGMEKPRVAAASATKGRVKPEGRATGRSPPAETS